MALPNRYSLLMLMVFTPLAHSQDTFDLSQALNDLKAAGGKTLTIPAGVHRLPKEGLVLEGFQDVVIEGKGATLVGSSFKRPGVHLLNCERVTFRGLSFDYDPLPFTQGDVTAVDVAARTVTFKVHEGYPALTDPYLVTRFHLFQPDEHRWKVGAPDYYAESVERLNDREARFTFAPGAPGLDKVKVGDRIAVNIREAACIDVALGTKDFVMEDCTILASPGLGVIIRFAENSGTYRRLRITPGPPPEGATQPRLLSTCADGVNAAYTRRGPVLEKCEFSFMGDDSLNVHGTILPVLETYEDGSFLSMRPIKDQYFERIVRPGDAIHFLEAPTYAVTGQARIAAFERITADPEKWRAKAEEVWPTFTMGKKATFFRVRLDKPVPAARPGAFFEIPATAATDYVVRDSHFHDHRARGLRLMGSNGLVENNRFERLKGVAISIGPSFSFWREAGWCRNITVRGNTLLDIGQGANLTWADSYTIGAISVIDRIDPTEKPIEYYPGNENIVLEGNTIDGCSLSAIQVCAAKDVRLTDNTIRNVNQVAAPDAGRDYELTPGKPITITQASVEQRDNTVATASAP